MERRILVTGAAGRLGGAVVETLARRGLHVRGGIRNRKGKSFSRGVETVHFDYDDRTTFGKALEDVDGIFLVAPPLDPAAHLRVAPFLAEARRTGRPHVVMTSALGMDQDESSPLRMLERTLMDSGLPWTILRPTFFMENFSEGWLAPSIREKRSIFLPAGEGKTAFVSVNDIAAVASSAFEGKRYGEEYGLTGPQALDHFEVARILGEEIGEEVRYVPLEEDPFLAEARKSGMPEGAVLYLAALYRMVRDGSTALVTWDVERVTGRKPATFREFTRRHAGMWKLTRTA